MPEHGQNATRLARISQILPLSQVFIEPLFTSETSWSRSPLFVFLSVPLASKLSLEWLIKLSPSLGWECFSSVGLKCSTFLLQTKYKGLRNTGQVYCNNGSTSQYQFSTLIHCLVVVRKYLIRRKLRKKNLFHLVAHSDQVH